MMTTIREVLREAATAVTLGAGFELIAAFGIAAGVVVAWLVVLP